MPKRPLAPPPGLDTRCSSCTGFTYYSSALKRLEEKPVCIGLKSNSETLPTPFEAPEEIQTAAEEQLEKEGGDMYYVCVGTSIMTPQMMDQVSEGEGVGGRGAGGRRRGAGAGAGARGWQWRMELTPAADTAIVRAPHFREASPSA